MAALNALLPLLAILACGGCQSGRELRLHYLSGFVPGARDEFAPTTVAVAPPAGVGVDVIGKVYHPDGSVKENLKIAGLGQVIQTGVARALADAGLKTHTLDYAPETGRFPKGTDYVVYPELDEISCFKHFGKRVTVHGRYFTMVSQVELKFTLIDRFGETLYSGESVGVEVEPPTPVHHEVFLPLETDPAKSLSIALSRAIGKLPLTAGFRRVLPQRAAAKPSSTPSGASPAAHAAHGGIAHY